MRDKIHLLDRCEWGLLFKVPINAIIIISTHALELIAEQRHRLVRGDVSHGRASTTRIAHLRLYTLRRDRYSFAIMLRRLAPSSSLTSDLHTHAGLSAFRSQDNLYC